jgi:hypothetical protein
MPCDKRGAAGIKVGLIGNKLEKFLVARVFMAPRHKHDDAVTDPKPCSAGNPGQNHRSGTPSHKMRKYRPFAPYGAIHPIIGITF